jgi:hypothetical protein
VGATLAVALLPKCPLCVAACLTAFGVGAGAAGAAAPFVRPAALIFALLALSAFAVGAWRARKRGQTPACCR